MSRPYTIVPLSGQITMTDLDNAFHLGTDLEAYRGVLYFKPSVDDNPRYFPASNLDMDMFHGTWAVTPPSVINLNGGEAGTFYIPIFRNFIIIQVWGAGGVSSDLAGAGGGAFRQFNYCLDSRANYINVNYGDTFTYRVGVSVNDPTGDLKNSVWNGIKVYGGGSAYSVYGAGGAGWNSAGGIDSSRGWFQSPGDPQIEQYGSLSNSPYNVPSGRGSGYYDGNLSPFGGGGGQSGLDKWNAGPSGGYAIFGGGGGGQAWGGNSKYGGAGRGMLRNGSSQYGGQIGQVPGGADANGLIKIFIDITPPLDATSDMVLYGAPPGNDAPTSGGPWANVPSNPGAISWPCLLYTSPSPRD